MKVEDWGCLSYQAASSQQLEHIENFSEDTLVFCSHNPVVTLGRGTQPGDVFAWSGEILETSRGGRATYHGPNQLIAYPIIDLSVENRKNIRPRDLRSYMHVLELSIVHTLKEIGIESEARTVKADESTPSLTGVWVGEKKIASIGIAVKKWISYHGLALNLNRDSLAFQGINPCGFRSDVMTSVEEILNQPMDRQEIQKILRQFLEVNLS